MWGEGVTAQEHGDTVGGDGNSLCLDRGGGGYTIIEICQNS